MALKRSGGTNRAQAGLLRVDGADEGRAEGGPGCDASKCEQWERKTETRQFSNFFPAPHILALDAEHSQIALESLSEVVFDLSRKTTTN